MSEIYRSRIITYQNRKLKDFKDSYLIIKDGKIHEITRKRQESYVDLSEYIILPGFIDTHIHLAQIAARAKWNPDLLSWLENHIFPAEAKFEDLNYAREKSKEFFDLLAENGTTTAAVYAPSFKDSTDIAFQEAIRKGLRVVMGQTLMDMNVPEELLTTVEKAKRDTIELANKWNRHKNLAYYAITPRFAISCSMRLMKELGHLSKEYDLFVQTHISEQVREIEKVKDLYPEFPNYAEVYHHANLLGSKTILAHGVHLVDEELKLLNSTHSKISHCPSSNFFLHSGIMNIDKIKSYNLTIGFGSDIGAGPYISMLQVARDASYANKISPQEAFYYLTLGGAEVLSLNHETGSLEKGKSGDFIVVKVPDTNAALDDILSYLIYRGNEENIMSTYVKGEKIYEAL